MYQCYGPFKCYARNFFLEIGPPPRNANKVGQCNFVALICTDPYTTTPIALHTTWKAPYVYCLQHSKPGTWSSGARHPNQGSESHALLSLFAAFQTWSLIIRSPSSQSGLSCPTVIVCSIPNLEPDHQEPVIPIRALMPYCHCLQHSKPGTWSSGARHPNQGSHALLSLFAAFQTWNPIIRSPSSQSGLSCPTVTVCSIPNLEHDHQEPVIPIRAQSLMPYCHCLQHSKPGTRSSGARHPNQGSESHALLSLFAAFQTWNLIIRSPSSKSGPRVSCPTATLTWKTRTTSGAPVATPSCPVPRALRRGPPSIPTLRW